MEGEWLSYGGGQFSGGRMVINFVTVVITLMEGKWSGYRGGHFIGRRMVMLERWSVKWRENGHLTEVVSLIEGEWSCYRGGH